MENDDLTRARALAMMDQRGLNRTDALIDQASPERIVAACEWFDAKVNAGEKITPRLLAWTISRGGITPKPGKPEPATCRRTPELDAAWAVIAPALRTTVGADTFDIWLAPAHPHQHGQEGWLLGAPAATASWVARRFGRLLERAAGEPVGVEACERLAG